MKRINLPNGDFITVEKPAKEKKKKEDAIEEPFNKTLWLAVGIVVGAFLYPYLVRPEQKVENELKELQK